MSQKQFKHSNLSLESRIFIFIGSGTVTISLMCLIIGDDNSSMSFSISYLWVWLNKAIVSSSLNVYIIKTRRGSTSPSHANANAFSLEKSLLNLEIMKSAKA